MSNRNRLKKVRAKNKLGEFVDYYYLKNGNERIRIPGCPGESEFERRLEELTRENLSPVKPKTFSLCIDAYVGSHVYGNLSQKSKKDYDKHIAAIREEFGDLPLSVAKDPVKARGLFTTYRDRISSSRQAQFRFAVLSVMCSHAVNRGLFYINPCLKTGNGSIHRSDRSDLIWSRENLISFAACASDGLLLAVFLAYFTGQRQGDLLKLSYKRTSEGGEVSWYDIDHGFLYFRTAKTGARVKIKVIEPLKGRLEGWVRKLMKRPAVEQRTTEYKILLNNFGKPWTTDGFRSSFQKARNFADIRDVASGKRLDFHDLRGTAVTNLCKVGCSIPEIAAITGHSMKTVEAILEKHYLGDRANRAVAAMEKWEKQNTTDTEAVSFFSEIVGKRGRKTKHLQRMASIS